MTEDIRKRVDNRNRLTDQSEPTGGMLDIDAIYRGAERAEQERSEYQRKLREQATEAQAKRDKELTHLLTKVGENLHEDTKAKAEKEIKEAKANAYKELEAKIRKQNGLKSEEEESSDRNYASMLDSLNLNKNK